MGVVGANDAVAIWSSCGFPETGDRVEGKQAEGRFVSEGGDRQSASRSGYTTAQDVLG